MIAAILALTAVAMLSQSLNQLDVIVERGQSAWVLLKISFLALPQLTSLVFPIAIFVGTLVALNRLHNEHEIVACYASGMSLWRIASPVLRLGVYITMLSLAMNLFIQPAASRLMRQELYNVKTDLASSLIREGDFSTTQSGLTIYVQRIDQNGLLRQIFIRTPGGDGMDRTYSAKEGRILRKDGTSSLVMRKGSMQQVSDKGVLNHLTFEEYAFDITNYFSSDDFLHYKESDRWMHELFYPNMAMDWERGNWKKLFAEGHSRLASPLYNIAFVLLATLGVLGGRFSRSGYTKRIMIVSSIAAGVRILGFGVEAACNNSAGMNFMQYVIPLTLIFLCAKTIYKNDRIKGAKSSTQLIELSPLSSGGQSR
ncbi:LPS export ABC transporter permease LptF [Asticcacaulis endophyticus]|uniref:LPS export ABC transporter permease LptF n=1 Tax=Asticcacaulis endophyticus TaxID=1395890 RepID=A0A918UWU5_9CAUL|nr:LPS export ABC transporter permease LptF [Asticcacaulis endophyticus]